MTLRLFNTLSGQVDDVVPADGAELRMYACGPTVYDYGHIGNFRTFLQVDVLRRFLKLTGTRVRHVMNITDVDDKIIRNSAAAGIPISEYTPKYVAAFFEDLEALRVERPEEIARATEHIEEMVTPDRAAGGGGSGIQDGGRELVFPAEGVSGVREAEQEGPERDGRRGAGGCGRVREGLGAGLCACGRRPNRARRVGRRRSGAGGRGGTSSARPWRWSTWARASICTRAART